MCCCEPGNAQGGCRTLLPVPGVRGAAVASGDGRDGQCQENGAQLLIPSALQSTARAAWCSTELSLHSKRGCLWPVLLPCAGHKSLPVKLRLFLVPQHPQWALVLHEALPALTPALQ